MNNPKGIIRVDGGFTEGMIFFRPWGCHPPAFPLNSSPEFPFVTGHHWDSTSLVWILSHWSVFQGGLGREGIQSTTIGHWGSPGLGSWTPPLLHIHYITGSHHTGTWLLLPLLRWWHTALSLFSTRWSNGSWIILDISICKMTKCKCKCNYMQKMMMKD